MKPGYRRVLILAGFACLPALETAPALAAKTVFRITDLDWRDPHVYVNFLGCRDVTDSPLAGFSMNGDLQTDIQTDGDGDGLLDRNYVIIFDPIDQAGAGGTLSFGYSACTAPPESTVCAEDSLYTPPAYAYTNMGSPCLGILAGTVRPYTPAVSAPGAPCFVATLGSVTLDVGFPVTLTDAYLAATYVNTPATTLVSGLIRGFLSEADANATIIPSAFPIVGGQPLSYLLPGGDPPGANNTNCAAHNDKDLGPGGVPGWYMYFNFTAVEVPYAELPTAVHAARAPLDLAAPVPNPFNPSTTLRYTLAEAAPVELGVYDLRGRLVARLAAGERGAGEHTAAWNGRDARGNAVGSGVYFVRLESRGETRVRKIVLLK